MRADLSVCWISTEMTLSFSVIFCNGLLAFLLSLSIHNFIYYHFQYISLSTNCRFSHLLSGRIEEDLNIWKTNTYLRIHFAHSLIEYLIFVKSWNLLNYLRNLITASDSYSVIKCMAFLVIKRVFFLPQYAPYNGKIYLNLKRVIKR